MRRAFVLWVLAASLTASAQYGTPGWFPSIGQTAILATRDGSSAYVAKDNDAEDQLRRVFAARDDVGLKRLIESQSILEIGHGTQVLVIGPSRTRKVIRAIPVTRIRQGEQVAPSTRYVEETLVEYWEVRIKEGTHKDRAVVVAPSDLSRYVPPPKPKLKPKTLKSNAPAAIASQAYRDARKLEAEGKLKEAIDAYKALSVSPFPEARLAAERLKVLTGK